MLEGTGTGNPNWVRDEVEEGNRQIKIREIKDAAVAKVAGFVVRALARS